jgi:hypothetical protein
VAAAATAVATAVAVAMTGMRRVAPVEAARLGPGGAGVHRAGAARLVPGAAELAAAAPAPGGPEGGTLTGGAGPEAIGTAR